MDKIGQNSNRRKILSDVTNEVVWDWDLLQNKIWWNQKYYNFLGYKKGKRSGYPSSWLSGIFPDDRERVNEELNSCIKAKRKSWISEFRILTSKFTILNVFCRGAIFYNSEDQATRFIGAMVDITNQKKTEEKLKKKNDELESIQAYLRERTEKEKSAISYKMHEQLGQELTAILQGLGEAIKKLETEPSAETSTLKTLKDQLKESIDKVRDISSELYPEILADIGIVEALEWYSEVYTAASGLEISFMSDADDLSLSPAAGIIVYRIFRDILQNISAHDASEIVVVVKADDDNFSLTIYDNGKNYMSSEDLAMSVQFRAMKAAFASVDGSLDIDIDWKEGTTFTLCLPLSKE